MAGFRVHAENTHGRRRFRDIYIHWSRGIIFIRRFLIDLGLAVDQILLQMLIVVGHSGEGHSRFLPQMLARLD